MTKEQKFQQLMQMIATNYNKDLSDAQISLFAQMSKNWGFENFYPAVIKHMTDPDAGMYFPNMAHIAKHIKGTEKDRRLNLESKASMQWFNVDRAIREVGSYRTPTFKDPITVATISVLGGWTALCQSTTEQLVWKQKEFIKTYGDFVDKPLEQLPNHIAGREDILKIKSNDNEVLSKLGYEKS